LRLIKEDGIHQKVKTEGRKESRSNFGWAKDFYFIFYFILLGAVEARTSQHCGRTSKLYVVQSKKENTDLKWGKKDLANFVFGLWNIFHSDTMKHRRELYLSFNSLYIVVPHFH
jgi:hypothetical protein